MSRFRYRPGETTKRQYTSYNAYQHALWKAFEDVYYADQGGYLHTRRPSPGFTIDPKRFKEWQERVLRQWEFESRRDKMTRPGQVQDLSEEAWAYFYEKMVAADPLRPAPLPQTDYYDG